MVERSAPPASVEAGPEDEYLLDTPAVRALIAAVRQTLAATDGYASALDALQPRFAALLADPAWLPAGFATGSPEGHMGSTIGQWLLFRAGDRTLTLFSLAVPPGTTTPVHDHLAWGLVGLYRGQQRETVYRRLDDGSDPEHAELEVAEVRTLRPGDCYRLVPPDGDIHAVETVSHVPSVSIHLLTNDTGYVWRHVFDPASGRVRPFRSGYSNTPSAGA